MTIGELRRLLDTVPTEHHDREVIVWLPGSTIRLSGLFTYSKDRYAIEGNLNPGSALEG